MKIAVLNGSPKGNYSTTLFSVKYLQKTFKNDEFEIVEVASKIRSLEKDFSPVIEAVQKADIILFSYPVYTFVVPAQLHRAVELLKEHTEIDWSSKFIAQITTSKHFYDQTAQKFIEENMNDLGAKYLRGFYADMEDLLEKKGQKELKDFWEYIRFRYDMYMEHNRPKEDNAEIKIAAPSRHEIAIVTDCKDNPRLKNMISRFRSICPARIKVINIADFPFKGGCISCFNCAADGTCIYKDGFSDLLRNEINTASAVIYAFTIKDHSMGAKFKMYDDRQFCNGHRMMTIGAPVGYIIDGDIHAENNLRTILEARAEVGKNFLCEFATDDDSIQTLSDQMLFILDNKITQPQNFYGVGGTKIFRDLIWIMRGLMRADHKFYKEHGIYNDLPQRNIGKMLKMKLVGLLFNNPTLRKKAGGQISEGMAAPYQKILDELEQK